MMPAAEVQPLGVKMQSGRVSCLAFLIRAFVGIAFGRVPDIALNAIQQELHMLGDLQIPAMSI